MTGPHQAIKGKKIKIRSNTCNMKIIKLEVIVELTVSTPISSFILYFLRTGINARHPHKMNMHFPVVNNMYENMALKK